WARYFEATACGDVEVTPLALDGSPPDYPNHLSDVPCPLPRRIKRVRVSIASPLMQPSPYGRRGGIRIVTFEACSGFTHVTAHRIAQPPKATFVTRLQPFRSPGRAARQLPDQSTIIWVDSSSTSDSRLRGALPTTDIIGALDTVNSLCEEPSFSCRQGGGSPPPAATGSPSPIRAVSEQHLHAMLSLVRRTGRPSSVPLASRPSEQTIWSL